MTKVFKKERELDQNKTKKRLDKLTNLKSKL